MLIRQQRRPIKAAKTLATKVAGASRRLPSLGIQHPTTWRPPVVVAWSLGFVIVLIPTVN